MSEPTTFLEYLEAFNRKERFFVVAAATGTMHENKAAFRLDPEFRQRLGEKLGLSVPESALGFMDYHLDWLHAAAALTKRAEGWPDVGIPQPPRASGLPHHPDTVSTGNQEDIDLVVAFAEGSVTHVVLLEAKAEAGWTNSQMNSKAPRLDAIFGPSGDAVPGVKPHFCLWSPKNTTGLTYLGWPQWCRTETGHHWLELKIPSGRWQVHRSDAGGAFASNAGHWSVKPLDRVDKT